MGNKLILQVIFYTYLKYFSFQSCLYVLGRRSLARENHIWGSVAKFEKPCFNPFKINNNIDKLVSLYCILCFTIFLQVILYISHILLWSFFILSFYLLSNFIRFNNICIWNAKSPQNMQKDCVCVWLFIRVIPYLDLYISAIFHFMAQSSVFGSYSLSKYIIPLSSHLTQSC